MQSPPKPYELNRTNNQLSRSVRGVSTTPISSNIPRIPPRTYSSLDSYSDYGKKKKEKNLVLIFIRENLFGVLNFHLKQYK